jgi:hypothetical protein
VTHENEVNNAFEQLGNEVEPRRDAWTSIRTEIERARIRHAILRVALAGVVALGAYALTQRIENPPVTIEPGPPGWSVYRDPTHGWTLQFPDSWHAQPVKDRIFQYVANGVLISNVDHRFGKPNLGSTERTSAWDMRGLPQTLVAIEVSWTHTGFTEFIPCDLKDTPFPLSLNEAERTTARPETSYGAPQPMLYLRFTAKLDSNYSARVWFGSQASAVDREIVERIVASISFENAYPPSPDVACT